MDFKELISELIRNSMPSGALRAAMFAFHNDMVGRSEYFPRWENPKTFCGSCISRVRSNVMRYYHFEYEPKFDEFLFTGKFGNNKTPMYGINKER